MPGDAPVTRVLEIVATLAAPVVLTDDLHLDGLLASAHPLCRAAPVGRDTPLAALIDPPLPIVTGTHAGHAARLATAAILPDTARTSSSHAVKRRDGEDLSHLARPIHLGLGPGKNRLHQLPVVVTPQITWRAIGDRRGVIRLARRITHLGSWRAAGYGEVTRWEVLERTDLDPACVLIDRGVAQRHLPAAWCASPGGWAASVVRGAAQAPYWHPARQTAEIVRAGTRCALHPELERLCHALADRDAQRHHRERHQLRARARRLDRDRSTPPQAGPGAPDTRGVAGAV